MIGSGKTKNLKHIPSMFLPTGGYNSYSLLSKKNIHILSNLYNEIDSL